MSRPSPPDLPSAVIACIACGISISAPAAISASAVPAPEPAPEPADTRLSKIAVGVSAGSAETAHSTPGGRRSNKIILLAMTLARLTTGWFSPLVMASVAPTLRLPLLLAAFGLAVAMPRLPLPPSSGLLSAFIAAVARQRVAGAEPPRASLQQTNPASWTASSPPRSRGSEMACLIFSGS